MVLSQAEVFIINRYAASELAGALLLGKKARETDSPYLRRMLTWHCAEEARHGMLWYNLINELQIPSVPMHDEQKEGYFSKAGYVKTMVEFLAFVHCYEHRVPFHFSVHADWTTNSRVKELLHQLIREEDAHIDWIKKYLIGIEKTEGATVREAMVKFRAIEEETYHEDLGKIRMLGKEGITLADALTAGLASFTGVRPWG